MQLKERWMKPETSSERLCGDDRYTIILDGMCFWTDHLRKGIESTVYFYRGVQVRYFHFMHKVSSAWKETAGHPQKCSLAFRSTQQHLEYPTVFGEVQEYTHCY